jgi:hypothetical protein
VGEGVATSAVAENAGDPGDHGRDQDDKTENNDHD